MIYVASPYSHDSDVIMEQRFLEAEKFVARALFLGLHVYSPIVHCHQLACKYDMPKNAKFWENYNHDLLERSDAVVVLRLDGWDESKGVGAEMAHARDKGIKVVTVGDDITDEVLKDLNRMILKK
jgi:hypothetical protein